MATRKPIAAYVVRELEAEVRRHRGCAFVVHWPVHEGRSGEQCGRVLAVLDSVIDESSGVVARKRPFALWTDTYFSRGPLSSDISPPDEWGRSLSFARAPESYHRGMRYSSKDHVVQRESSATSSAVAARVLDGWVRNYWDIDDKIDEAPSPRMERCDYPFTAHAVDGLRTEMAHLQAALP